VVSWIGLCLTSPPTQYRLYGRRFLQVKRPNQQYWWVGSRNFVEQDGARSTDQECSWEDRTEQGGSLSGDCAAHSFCSWICDNCVSSTYITANTLNSEDKPTSCKPKKTRNLKKFCVIKTKKQNKTNLSNYFITSNCFNETSNLQQNKFH